MSWYKFSFSRDDVINDRHTALQGAFTTLFIAAGRPLDAALFAGHVLKEMNAYYLSPKAAEIAKVLIGRFGGTECPAPTESAVDLVVGSQARAKIPFAPEAKTEEADNG